MAVFFPFAAALATPVSVCVAIALALLAGPHSALASPKTFTNPEPVQIDGYDGHAMEPFISRDGTLLLFNNRNEAPENTDLHWAEKVTPVRFSYRGKITGVNTPALEGVPTLDESGNLYFVSPRSYDTSLSTIYHGRFEKGAVTQVNLVQGLSRKRMGSVNFDVEVSADGRTLYFTDGEFTGGPMPAAADLAVAHRTGAAQFGRDPRGAALLANVNTPSLEYAAAISADGLELFFTRVSGAWFWRKLTIEHAWREGVDKPFGASKTIGAIQGFVEGPTITGDGRSLYYHAKAEDKFRIFRVTR